MEAPKSVSDGLLKRYPNIFQLPNSSIKVGVLFGALIDWYDFERTSSSLTFDPFASLGELVTAAVREAEDIVNQPSSNYAC